MTTLKGVFPDTKPVKRKNFIHENVKNLRRMEHHNKKTERLDEVSKLQLQQKKVNNSNNSCSHFHNVSSKPNSSVQIKKRSHCGRSNVNNQTDWHQEFCKKSSAPTLSKKPVHSTNDSLLNMENRKEHKESPKSVQKVQEKVSSVPNLLHKSLEDMDNNPKIKVKSQGIQTLDAKEIDELYAEGIVKYCSKKFVSSNESINKNETSKKVVTSPKNVVNLPSDGGDNRLIKKGVQNKNDAESSKSLQSKEETSLTKPKKDHNSVTNKIGTQMNNSSNSNNSNNNNSNNNSVPTNYRMGVIPKYIKNRKESQEKLQKAKIEVSDPNCPKGHVPLPDSERKETLRMLKKNYQEYVKQLNMMPINVDTLRAQRQKIEIEKQLNKLEEGIKVFSRPKVYVKMNA